MNATRLDWRRARPKRPTLRWDEEVVPPRPIPKRRPPPKAELRRMGEKAVEDWKKTRGSARRLDRQIAVRAATLSPSYSAVDANESYTLAIDKICICYSDPDPANVMTTCRHLTHAARKGILSSAKTNSGPRYRVACTLAIPSTAPGGEATALFQAGPFLPGVPSYRLEFNPAKVGPTGLALLSAFLASSAGVPLRDFFLAGTVTRIDLALDLPGLTLEDVIVRSHRKKKHGVYSDSSDCTNVEAVATIVGVNTLLLTFDANPVPDMIAVGLTPSKDGYSRIPGLGGTGIFVIAATNIGVGASLTARVRLLDASTPLTATLCETDPNTGQCKMTPAPTDTRTINHNENTTWTAFLQANNAIAPDPARFRVMFEFVDGNGVIRGSTSTAVTTQ